MQRICVYTGSNRGVRPEYAEAAQALGREMVARGLELVYGGASVGLMGLLANTMLEAGGEVIGIIPTGLLRREVGHEHLTELREVGSMHERKALMAELADGFITLPGGFGTLDELFEITTWAQLGMHAKPIGLLNVQGFFDPLLQMVEHMAREGFIAPAHTQLLLVQDTPKALLECFAHYTPPAQQSKWRDRPLEP